MAEKAKDLLAKMRFAEMLAAHRSLSPLELRVGIYLVSRCNMKRGYAWPPIPEIVADVANPATKYPKRAVQDAVNKLEALGLFKLKRSTGRGNSHEYRPNFALVPAGDVWHASRPEKVKPTSPFNDEGADPERVKLGAERVKSGAVKGEAHFTPTEEVLNRGRINRSTTVARSSERAGPEKDLFSAENIDATLARFERAFRADKVPHDSLHAWRNKLHDIANEYPYHDGNSIGGRAARLCQDVFDREMDLYERGELE